MAAANLRKSLTIFTKMPCEGMSAKQTFIVHVSMQNVPFSLILTNQSSVKGELAVEALQELTPKRKTCLKD